MGKNDKRTLNCISDQTERKCDGVDCIYLSRDRVHWWDLVNKVNGSSDSTNSDEFREHIINYQLFKQESGSWN
jgi:hypothetical protein